MAQGTRPATEGTIPFRGFKVWYPIHRGIAGSE